MESRTTAPPYGGTHIISQLDTPATTASGVAWASIFAGAAAAAALSLILLMLGAGLGLSAVSPWSHEGMSAGTFGVSTVIWITLTQLLASGMGGYLAGRLRTTWAGVHTDEVYFRDTAHGFLTWAIASLVTAAFLTSAIAAIVGSGVQAGATAGGAVVAAGTAAVATATGSAGDAKPASGASTGIANPLAYSVDALFRKDAAAPAAASTTAAAPISPTSDSDTAAASTAEVTRIIANSIRTGALPPEDVRYVGQLVAQRTGLAQPEAEKRVNEIYTRLQTRMRDAEVATKEAADKARKATAYTTLWLFISLLIGAFVASLAATFGGRQRDNSPILN